VTCEKCGATLAIGDFPFCPHGRYRGNTESDGIPGGETLENVGPEPVTFYSRSEKRRYLKEHGLVEMVRHVPVPGTDTSPHTTSWTGVNLEAGRILAERQAQTKASTTPHRANPETIAVIKQFYEEHYAQHGRD
jgi:hypothetical protein